MELKPISTELVDLSGAHLNRTYGIETFYAENVRVKSIPSQSDLWN